VIADFGADGVPAPESLVQILSVTEDLIRIRRGGWSERFPIGDGASWQTLENLCCHRWAIMAEIARLRNDRPAA
jgi:hypothetical protein